VSPSDRDARDPLRDEPDVFVERALASVRRPAARAEFKEKLCREFSAVPRRDAKTPLFDVVDEPRPVRSTRRGGRLVWAGLAAAAAVIAMLAYLKPSDSRWRVVEGTAAGVVTIDGVSISSDDRERLERSLVEARNIHAESRLRLRFADWYLLELEPHSDVQLSPIEQRTRTEPLYLQVGKGTLCVCTGPSFRGAEMRIDTDEVSLRVTGTNFAVDLVADGTCVCCLHGALKATPSKSKTTEAVGDRRTFHVFKSGEEPKRGEIVERHAEPLHELEELALRLWSR
jgi:ferric-dicitrate binding protein FerR (iron transport regulator)